MTTMMRAKPPFKRGDVLLVLFPHSDLRAAKTRPVLVVQADDLGTGLAQVIVAMITSKVVRADHPSRVLIRLGSNEGKESGLLTDSVVMADNLATILETVIDQKIGTLPMSNVDKALRHTLELETKISQAR